MKVYQTGRGGGKTHHLLDQLEKSDGVLVVPDERRVVLIRRIIKESERKIDPSRIMALSSMRGKLRQYPRPTPIYVDDLDAMLLGLFLGRIPVEATTTLRFDYAQHPVYEAPDPE